MKKNNDFISSAKGYRTKLLICIFLIIVSVVLTIIAPRRIQELTNIINQGVQAIAAGTGKIDLELVSKVGFTLIAFYGISFITSAAAEMILNTGIQHYSRDLRDSLIKKINKLPLAYYNERPIGDILSIITNDVDTLATALQSCIGVLVKAVITLIGVVIAMFVCCAPLAVIVLISLPLIVLTLFVIMKIALPLYSKNQQYLGELNSCIEENFSGQMIIKAFNAEEIKTADFAERNRKLGKVLFLSQMIGDLIEPAMSFISYLTYGAVLIVGGWMVVDGQLDFGAVTAFMIYISLFQTPLSEIGQAGNSLQLATASAGRVFEFLSAKEMPDDSDAPDYLDHDHIRGQVEFKDVCFGYRPNEMFVKHFSKEIQPGMKVAVVGPTGAGKSTLVNLLMRFFDVNSGDILVDGVSINKMSKNEDRRLFGMILQEPWVMNGTLRENLVYNLKDVSDEDIQKALEATGLKHYVDTLPNGLDTVIRGSGSLSAGQQQLLTIARAMLENAPMMILDEATSNVDTRTEILISKSLDALMEGRTSFVIAHRLSTIRNANLILVMNQGNIVEMGTHESLLAENGLYAEIYNAQFQK